MQARSMNARHVLGRIVLCGLISLVGCRAPNTFSALDPSSKWVVRFSSYWSELKPDSEEPGSYRLSGRGGTVTFSFRFLPNGFAGVIAREVFLGTFDDQRFRIHRPLNAAIITEPRPAPGYLLLVEGWPDGLLDRPSELSKAEWLSGPADELLVTQLGNGALVLKLDVQPEAPERATAASIQAVREQFLEELFANFPQPRGGHSGEKPVETNIPNVD
jgi:hypothetical protein